MPMYEFHCVRCGRDFEELVTSREEAVHCPECGSKRTKKRISAFSFKSTSKDGTTTSSSGGGCASCSSKNCASCH